MQTTVMYIHGYGSDGNAVKGRLLRRMLPDCRVVSPTFDYDNLSPLQVQDLLARTVADEGVRMLVGSSFGGYHALCATASFRGPVWAVNPVHDVVATMRRVVPPGKGEAMLAAYADFDRRVFQRLSSLNRDGSWPADTPLHFALTHDDELLGDHTPLLALFPSHRLAVWKDSGGHRFLCFDQLQNEIASSLCRR